MLSFPIFLLQYRLNRGPGSHRSLESPHRQLGDLSIPAYVQRWRWPAPIPTAPGDAVELVINKRGIRDCRQKGGPGNNARVLHTWSDVYTNLLARSKRSLLKHPSVLKLDDSVPVGSVLFRVSNLNYRCALLVQPGEKVHYLLALAGVQVSGRLVGQNHLGVGNDG